MSLKRLQDCLASVDSSTVWITRDSEAWCHWMYANQHHKKHMIGGYELYGGGVLSRPWPGPQTLIGSAGLCYDLPIT